MTIAQVQVDGAYWAFTQDPPGPLPRFGTAWLRVPYWVQGETHGIVLLSSAGVPFEHTIDVAVATPTRGSLTALGLVGLFVGVVPVALGMLFYPALKAGGQARFDFALALTVGLLLFLLVDTLEEALELAAEAAPGFHAAAMVWLVAAMTAGLLYAVGRRGGRKLGGLGLATSIALGIGLHNLGEGLAIGSAFATGAAALGTFLVLGFTLHHRGDRHRRPPGRDAAPAADLRGARAARRPAGRRRRLARQLRLRAALGGTRHGGGSGCDLPGRGRGRAAAPAPRPVAGGSVATVPATAGLVAGIVVMYDGAARGRSRSGRRCPPGPE